MKSTVAGENSLEAIRLAAAAGFDCIETDVRLTADSVLVIMHDATLRRTCLTADGCETADSVANLPMAQLKDGYILKASHPEMRSRIPSLREYLEVCRDCSLKVFIEPKLNDTTGRFYLDIIRVADEILGREHYVITSNNFANDIIRRKLGITDVELMGILYQTTYEDIGTLGNTIMAVSASRFSKEEHRANVIRSISDGFQTESHADKFAHFDLINGEHIDFVSTDFLVPDYHGQGKSVFKTEKSDRWSLMPSDTVAFGALYLDIRYKGNASVQLGRQKFNLSDLTGVEEPDGFRRARHQLLLFEESPSAQITPSGEGFETDLASLRLVTFDYYK